MKSGISTCSICVNLDHVATLRQARLTSYPSLIETARIVDQSTAVGVTLHLREDRRHVQDHDVFDVKQNILKKLNLEMSTARDIVELCLKALPAQATLVPERRQELTTEGGLNVFDDPRNLRQLIATLQSHKIVVSLFIDPTIEAVETSAAIGADIVELHTGAYAQAFLEGRQIDSEIQQLRKAALHAHEAGLLVYAGHGLTLDNVSTVAQIPYLSELNIGHGLVSHAVEVGLRQAIADFSVAMNGPAPTALKAEPILSA